MVGRLALNGNMYKSGLERPLKPLKGSISAIPEDVTQSCTQDTYGNFGTFIFCCWSREGPGPGCEAQQGLPTQVLVKRGLQDGASILFCSCCTSECPSTLSEPIGDPR